MNINTLHKATSMLQSINGLGRIIETVETSKFQDDPHMGRSAFEVESHLVDEAFYEKLRRMYLNALIERKANLQAEFDAL